MTVARQRCRALTTALLAGGAGVGMIEAIEFGPAEKRETHEVQFSVPFTGTRDP